MRMAIKSDHVVRTLHVLIKDGPIMTNDWATWRKTPRPFKLAGLVITTDGSGLITDVLVTGPLVLKGGRLSETQTDEVRLYRKDLDIAPMWLRTLVLDAISNVRSANYPDPSGGTLGDPIGVGR